MTIHAHPLKDDPIDFAHAYAIRGWRVLPIKPGEKRPPMKAWQEAATTEPAMIDKWWTELYRGHGVGVATGPASGIFVLDVDISGDKAGDETLASLEAKYGELPATPTVTTASGGAHYYFAYPDDVEIRNDAGKRLGQGLDIRGDGGQVVAPPTMRGIDGYEWVDGTYGLEVADAPRWLIERVAELPKPSIVDVPMHTVSDGTSIAETYNTRTTWPRLLEADGWTLAEVLEDGEQHWTRPGKDSRDGISATVGHGGGDQLTVFTTSVEWLPSGSYSRFGYYAARFHAGDRSGAARALRTEANADAYAVLDAVPLVEAISTGNVPVRVSEPSEAQSRIELAHLIDWKSFWENDHSDEDWLAYPLIPRGRAIALYAAAKAGKSTIVLAAAAAVATGRPVLGARKAEPVTTLYLDYEMTQADLQQRLMELGYGPEDDLARLRYALLPSLPPMDTVEGAMAVLDLVDLTSAEYVVFDTFGRAVGGEEDQADTVRNFYRHTGLALKARGITYLRTDHSGKDTAKGMRGSSAKNDDVDLVWKLTRADISANEHGVKIQRTHSRISWIPETLIVKRVETNYGFDYRLDQDAERFPDGTAQDMHRLIKAGLKFGDGQRQADEIRKEHCPDMTVVRMRNAHRMLKNSDPTKTLGEPAEPRRRGDLAGVAVDSSRNGVAVDPESVANVAVNDSKGVEGVAVDDSGVAVSASQSVAPPPYRGGASGPGGDDLYPDPVDNSDDDLF